MIKPFIRGDVLDLGCAGAAIRELGKGVINEYYGVDFRSSVIEELQRENPEGKFYCRDLDHDDLDFDMQFDCIVMAALIEHLYNQQHVMSQIRKRLKPSGVVVITTPTPFGNDVVHKIGAKMGLFAASAMEDHVVVYNRHRFRIMARDLGFEVVQYRTFQLGCNQLVILRRKA